MGNRSRTHTERLARILDNLGEHIRTAPGEELLEAAREEGRKPAEVTARIRGLLQSTFKLHQQKALVEAKEGYRREIASMSERRFNLPRTAKGRRKWFLAVLAQAPQLQPAFTLQNRELSEISDEDIESHLKKLAQLGVLDALSLPEDE
jgi:hypothetical protein